MFLSPIQLKEIVNTRLETLGNELPLSGGLAEPMRYMVTLGGKRYRPVMALLAYQALQPGAAEEALDLACAVELFHNFTLLHDDIMDRSPVRRGKQTVHERWDVNRAILSGDAMFAWSMSLLVKNFSQQAHRLVEEYARIAMEVCDGQMLDMDGGEGRATASEEWYVEMIRLKTAVLLGGSLSMAGIAAGAPQQQVNLLYDLGEKAGIGFQLQDDYLDAFGETELTGKQRGGDIIEGKMTFLRISAMQMASPADQSSLNKLYAENTPDKVERVLEIFERSGAKDHTETLFRACFTDAQSLSAEFARRPGWNLLDDFLKQMMQRTF